MTFIRDTYTATLGCAKIY